MAADKIHIWEQKLSWGEISIKWEILSVGFIYGRYFSKLNSVRGSWI